MLANLTHSTAAVELEPGLVLATGPAAAMETEVAGLLLATPTVVMAVSSATGEVLAALGVFFWVIPLLVWIVRDVSHAVHHVHLHDDRPPNRPHAHDTAHHHAGVRR